ncbi:MAG: 50S ribosomal protein L4 [Mycoplasma sp.]
MQAKVLNNKGQEVKNIKLADDVFAIENPNSHAIFSSVISEEASWRQGTHSTKTKAEVSGGGKKPWAQKGTGNARQGSTRNPQWRHGGIAFGPRPNRNYSLKLNKKEQNLSLRSALSIKMAKQEITIIDSFSLNEFSTKKFLTNLKDLGLDNKKVLIIANQPSDFLAKSVDNVANVLLLGVNQVTTRSILNNDVILASEESIKALEERLVK